LIQPSADITCSSWLCNSRSFLAAKCDAFAKCRGWKCQTLKRALWLGFTSLFLQRTNALIGYIWLRFAMGEALSDVDFHSWFSFSLLSMAFTRILFITLFPAYPYSRRNLRCIGFEAQFTSVSREKEFMS
jgi:hypothetical protein